MMTSLRLVLRAALLMGSVHASSAFAADVAQLRCVPDEIAPAARKEIGRQFAAGWKPEDPETLRLSDVAEAARDVCADRFVWSDDALVPAHLHTLATLAIPAVAEELSAGGFDIIGLEAAVGSDPLIRELVRSGRAPQESDFILIAARSPQFLPRPWHQLDPTSRQRFGTFIGLVSYRIRFAEAFAGA